MIALESKVLIDGDRKGVIVARKLASRMYLIFYVDGYGAAGWVHEDRIDPDGQLALDA